jgi:hypothetical protein
MPNNWGQKTILEKVYPNIFIAFLEKKIQRKHSHDICKHSRQHIVLKKTSVPWYNMFIQATKK